MNTTKICLAEVHRSTKLIGHNEEDGSPIYRDIGCVQAIDEEGRWYALKGSALELWDFAEEKEVALLHLAAKVHATGEINLEHWAFSRWSYGSKGWNEQELSNEISEARMAGEVHPLDR